MKNSFMTFFFIESIKPMQVFSDGGQPCSYKKNPWNNYTSIGNNLMYTQMY